ncbi:uncharacterized protein [Nicotiana tomentosiformis]|uniref:uncharacterized protein n=1 Tax=Nicotiana tomentosiformis TaxID=4098 RepID=UPI00051B1C1A|nr:uncharacterized protein LOC104109193 [Nicotiana tomentosiformis]XP_033515323.1 uncharacterized protein LOC104109193 [Nicotiana tomentosiformis]
MFMLQHSAYFFQLPRTSHSKVFSPQFSHCDSFLIFHPKQSSCMRTLMNCQREKTLLTTFEENNDDGDYIDVEMEEGEEEAEGFSRSRGFRGREDEKNYDKDPELAEILGSCLDDPVKAQSRMEERLRKKRNKIVHTKTGSATPMNVTFNKFDFTNSYIWFEFYNAPLEKDISLICDTIRSWHIVGRLGGCNSLNMQLSQSPLDKRPSYDAVQGANVNPTTFYNIGDLEIQDNLARIWVDIGTSEHLLLDVLINALTQISSDYVGIKQLVFGESEFENWRENLTSEDAGYSVHTI